MSHSERTPLLWDYNNGQVTDIERPHGYSRELPKSKTRDCGEDVHAQFCALVGCPPSNVPDGYKHRVNEKSLYGRTTKLLRRQGRTYALSASISNTLLLVQVVLGAALTGLGASNSPGWVITLFGATNTVIAGLVAYLKSRGQPMRARMYRDDVERVVNEIENSEIMWLGISQGVHGYDDIDTDGAVTVRSEVARLTRLYDRAVRNNTMNNPEMYMSGQSDGNGRTGLRDHAQMANVAVPAVMPAAEADAAPAAPAPAPAAPAPVATDPDASPASANIKPKEETAKDEDAASQKSDKVKSPAESSADKGKAPEGSASKPAPPASPPPPAAAPVDEDPDAAPATKAKFSKKSGDSEIPKKVQGDEY